MPANERHSFAARAIVASLKQQAEAKNSFALIRPRNPKFIISKKSSDEFEKEKRARELLHQQIDIFSVPEISKDPSPYKFIFQFEFDGKKDRKYKCIDWETEATFFKWRAAYGEASTLDKMQERFGVEYPKKGMVFAMGTHRNKLYKDTWLLSAVLRVDEDPQLTLF